MRRQLLGRRSGPRISIVVVVYRMPAQAERTLHSLTAGYQAGVDERDYEVIVVENRSDQLLGPARALATGRNVRYFHRDEPDRTPVHAVNYGVSKARARHVAVMIDGARLLSPGVVGQALKILASDRHAAITTPGYHIGAELQQVAVNGGYDERSDAALLEGIGWPTDGYRLFDIAVLSGSCQRGFFHTHGESNFVATSMQRWDSIGGMDARYNDFGGGMANFDLYKRLLETPCTPWYLLFAEGSFHQFHGGITTNTRTEERERILEAIHAQDLRIRGEERRAPKASPVFFGAVHPRVHRFIRHSLDKAPPA